MFNFANVYQQIAQHPQLQLWLNTLPQQLTDWQAKQHGDLDRWMRNLKKIPVGQPEVIDLKNAVAAHNHQPLAQGEQKKLEAVLKTFHPWRKGPYHLHGIHIDTEWRSDWKWDR